MVIDHIKKSEISELNYKNFLALPIIIDFIKIFLIVNKPSAL